MEYLILASTVLILVQIHHNSAVDRLGRPPRKSFVALSKEALRRKHAISPSVTLKTGYDRKVKRRRQQTTKHFRTDRMLWSLVVIAAFGDEE